MPTHSDDEERSADVRIENHGSIMLFQPLTPEGESWIEEHTDPLAIMRFCGALVVEPRYAGDLAVGMQEDGLKVC